MGQETIEALASSGLLPWAFQGVTTVAVGVCTFIMLRLIRDVDVLKEDQKRFALRCPAVHATADSALAQFKLFVASEYAKTGMVTRLHERLDDVYRLLVEIKESKKV